MISNVDNNHLKLTKIIQSNTKNVSNIHKKSKTIHWMNK